MTGAVAIVVAVIAAVTSIGGAISSHLSARSANRTAREVAGLGHRIDGAQRAIESFRSDYGEFMRAVGAMRAPNGAIAAMAAAEILRANPLSTDDLDAAVDHAVETIIAKVTGQQTGLPESIDVYLAEARRAARSILTKSVNDRDNLISQRRES